jgi:hypothetical protein
MTQQPPLRNRPNLHLALTQFNGSPRQQGPGTPLPSSCLSTPYPSPAGTPYGKTSYSPYSSGSLVPPTPSLYGSSSSSAPGRNYASYGDYNWFRVRRTFASKPVWLLLMIAALFVWWFNGGGEELDLMKLGASDLGKELLSERKMHNYQFYPASNPKIHVGFLHKVSVRWWLLIAFSMSAAGRPLQIVCAKMAPFPVVLSVHRLVSQLTIDLTRCLL